jgi:predicted ester cyclase
MRTIQEYYEKSVMNAEKNTTLGRGLPAPHSATLPGGGEETHMKTHYFKTCLIALTLTQLVVAQIGPSSVPSAQQKVVLSYFHDVLDGDREDLIDGMFLSDCSIHRPEGELKGIAALHRMRVASRASFATMNSQIHEIFEAGDRVVVRLTHKGTGKGSYRFRIGIRDITSKDVTWDAIVIFRFQNGKIAEEWVSRDELGMLLSAGILASEPVAAAKP